MKMTEALEIYLDYLVGSTDLFLDRNIVNRALDKQKLKESEKQHVFALLDAYLQT